MKKGAVSKNKKGTSLFVAKSWGGGTCPQCLPVPTSMTITHLLDLKLGQRWYGVALEKRLPRSTVVLDLCRRSMLSTCNFVG